MTNQDDIITFLTRGSSYGLADALIEHIETHISHVFLVGDRAYKLKKALRLPYVDYSTVALRESLCRKELVLNRRTAPDLYLGVHAVTREADNRLAFDGDGPAIDWVLEMRRFPARCLFEDLAESGQLTPALIRDVIDSVVAFHNTAEIITDRGSSAAIRAVIEGNRLNLLTVSPPLDRDQAILVSKRSLARWSAIAVRLDARQREGKVRRCHGDLHLSNICLFEGKPTLFDCIEFNDDLACIDVFYDLAFLLMDLGHRRLLELATLAFNRYIDVTADTGALGALGMFMSIRAAVRAHVTLTRPHAVEDPRIRAEAQSYLAFADSLLEIRPPIAIAVGGYSGTGKSTLARALASALVPPPGMRHIRSDAVRKHLAGLWPETALPPSAYTPQSAERVYAELYREASAVLAAGLSVVIDATFLDPSERMAIAAVAEKSHIPFRGFWLEASRSIMEARLDARHSDASDADRKVLHSQLSRDTGPINWYRLDANRETAALVAQVRELVGST